MVVELVRADPVVLEVVLVLQQEYVLDQEILLQQIHPKVKMVEIVVLVIQGDQVVEQLLQEYQMPQIQEELEQHLL